MHLKDKGRKGMIASFGVTALCGVTEPAFYGSLIMRPRVLVGTAIGAAGNMIVALASGIVAVVVAFIACTVILKKAYKEDV